MKVEELKEKARRHEQKEEWQKALDLYRDAIRHHPEDEPPDINLFNRVGDLQTRLGQIEGAVKMYEQAIDHYLEAELPNNAIAICKKVLRNLPDRLSFFLRMGQIRARQGFLTDARQSFLTYAERMTAFGDMESALNALVEFVDLSPEDVEIRLGLASQLESHGREEEAAEQLTEAYRRLILLDRDEEAEGVAEKLREIAPEVALPDPQALRAGARAGVDDDQEETFGGFELGSGIQAEVPVGLPEVDLEFEDVSITGSEPPEEEDEEEEAAVREPVEEADEEADEVALEEEPEPVEVVAALEESDASQALEEIMDEAPEGVEGEPEGEGEDEEEAEPLPFLSLDEEEEESVPTFGFGGEAVSEGEFDVFAGDGEPGAEEDDSFRDEGEDEEEGEPLPTFGFAEDGEFDVFAEEEAESGAEEGEPLPIMALDEGEDAEDVMAEAIEEALEEERGEEFPEELLEADAPAEVAEPLPRSEDAPAELDLAVETPVAAPPATHAEAAAQGDLELAMEMVRSQIASDPDGVEHHQRLVEYAFRLSDSDVLAQAYMELAGCLARTGARGKAKAVYQQVLALVPGHAEADHALQELEGAGESRRVTQVASSEEYVDLGAMILGEEAEKTTRWKVTADTPTGDDQADFAKMLSQFKKKVAEHVDVGDVAAHHDLGTAYMEMGLLEEAISEFQMALRAKPDHLPTFEVMGRCWMEMGKPDMAVRTLGRALDADPEVEDELIGIYYLMGRAKEELGNKAEAVEFYEKVFSLDINFVDVTERLRALR